MLRLAKGGYLRRGRFGLLGWGALPPSVDPGEPSRPPSGVASFGHVTRDPHIVATPDDAPLAEGGSTVDGMAWSVPWRLITACIPRATRFGDPGATGVIDGPDDIETCP